VFVPSLMRYLLDIGKIHGDCVTMTDKTMAENLVDVEPIPLDNPIIMLCDNPIKETGHLQIM